MAFLFNLTFGFAWAEDIKKPLLTGSSRGGGSRPGLLKERLMDFKLPLSLGYTREIYDSGGDKPVVIYLQDAHCNYSCQKSIESIIGHFYDRYGIDVAALEGGAGNYNFSIFTSIPDIEIRERVADYFVREGRVTGAELYAIINPGNITVKGLEDPTLYEENLTVYRESLSFKDRVEKYLDTIKHFIENLKAHIFSKKTKSFDEKKKSYEDNKTPLKDYIVYLDKLSADNAIKVNQFENLSRLLKLIDDEKGINFEKAQSEREIVLDVLTDKLSKVEIARLIDNTMLFKKGEISPASFYSYLFKKIYSCRIDLKDYPHLVQYKEYLDQYDRVEKNVFFEEMFDVEHYIAGSLLETEDEKRLFQLSDDLYILNKLFSAALTRQQYDYFSKRGNEVNTHHYVDFIQEKAPWYNITADINPEVEDLDGYKEKMTKFYTYSFDRDQVFMKNIEKYSENTDALFVVTGGFHTENITGLLKEKGFSYILITPKLTQEKYNPYFKLLAGGLSPIESVLSEYTSVIAIRSVFSEMGLAGEWEYMHEAAMALALFLRDIWDPDAARQTGDILIGMPQRNYYLRLTLTTATIREATSLQSIDGVNLYARFVSRDDPAIQDMRSFDLANMPEEMENWMAEASGERGETAYKPITGLDGKISVHPETGRIRYSGRGPIVDMDVDLWGARHGKTPANVQKVLMGSIDTPGFHQLDQTGWEQAGQAAVSLFGNLEEKIRAGEEIVVVTSGLTRTKETASAFTELVKTETDGSTILTPVPLADANEMGMGICTNHTYVRPRDQSVSDELRRLEAQYGVEIVSIPTVPENEDVRNQLFDQGNAAVKFSDGESFVDLLIRTKRLLEHINNEYKGKTVVLFGHAMMLSAVSVLLRQDIEFGMDAAGEEYIDWRNVELSNAESKRLASGLEKGEAEPPDRGEASLLTQPTLTVNEYVETQTGPALDALPYIRSDTNVGIVVEVNADRMAYPATEMQGLEEEVKRNIRQLTNYKGKIEVEIATTREEVKGKVRGFVDQDLRPVVFALPENVQDLAQTLSGYPIKIPFLHFNLPAEGKALMNIGNVVRLAILVDELSEHLQSTKPDRDRMEVLITRINALKTALQLDSTGPFELAVFDADENFLYSGQIGITLPPVTRITGELGQVFRSMKKLEYSL